MQILKTPPEDDTFTFTVYDNFFDKKEFKDNRAGVIIHELCHLCDIEEGADMYDMDSAECLKNIILCLCEKLSLKQIRQEYANKQEPQERSDDTLTYDPDQPRVPAGSSEGGQWTDSGGSGSSGSSNNDESKANNGYTKEDNPNIKNTSRSETILEKDNIKLGINKKLSELSKNKNPIKTTEIYKAVNFSTYAFGKEIVGMMYAGKKDGYFNVLMNTFATYAMSKIISFRKNDPDTQKYMKEEEYNKITRNPKETSTFSGAAMSAVKSLAEINNLKKEAEALVKDLFSDLTKHVDNEADAFRHTYFNYRLTELIGADDAKSLSDAYEISGGNEKGSMCMDLINNQIGRDLYEMNKTKGKEAAITVIMEAYKSGLLRETPFIVKKKRSRRK